MLLHVFYAGFGLLLLLGLYALIEIKRTYNKREVLRKRASVALWMLDIIHLLLVVLASSNRVWLLPFSDTLSVAAGVVLLGVGAFLMLAGMVKFRSVRRISGLEISQLVVTGVYRWTRNPQYLGWSFILFGISFIGRSGLAFLLAILGIVLFHYYVVRVEEPFLERAFGDKYYQYKSNVPRYLGLHSRRIRKEKNKRAVTVEAKAILVSLVVLVVFAVSMALGYLICAIIGIPSSFGLALPLRLFGVFVLASGFILLGWLFKFRKPVDIMISTYVTIMKVIGGVPFDDSSGRTETLVVQGPYKHVRHPLYFDVVVLMVGWWLLLDYSFLLLSAVFLLLWFNYVVAPFEEKELRAIFGEQYEQYSNEVPRIIPFTKRRKKLFLAMLILLVSITLVIGSLGYYLMSLFPILGWAVKDNPFEAFRVASSMMLNEVTPSSAKGFNPTEADLNYSQTVEFPEDKLELTTAEQIVEWSVAHNSQPWVDDVSKFLSEANYSLVDTTAHFVFIECRSENSPVMTLTYYPSNESLRVEKGWINRVAYNSYTLILTENVALEIIELDGDYQVVVRTIIENLNNTIKFVKE